MEDELKNMLGDSYNPEVSTKLKNFIGKNFVSKSDYVKRNNQLKELKSLQIEKRATALVGFKDRIHACVKKGKTTPNWEQKYHELEQQSLKQQENYQKHFNEFRLDNELKNAKVRNLKAVKALIDTSKLKFNDTDIEGLNETLDELKKTDGYLFEQIPSNGAGGFPAQSEPQKAAETPPRPKVI